MPAAPAPHARSVLVIGSRSFVSRVQRMLEGELGWQVSTEIDPLLPCELIVTDGAHVDALIDAPRLMLVDPHVAPADAAAIALRSGADGVVSLTAGSAEIAEWFEQFTAGAVTTSGVLTVAGAAGGVGTSTVVLSLAALIARSGRRVVAAVDSRICGRGELLDSGSLGGPSLADAAEDVLTNLAVVRLADTVAQLPARPTGDVDLIVIDLGLDTAGIGADVLVGRRDRASLAAFTERPAGRHYVVDHGPISWRSFNRVTPSIHRLPSSSRVARAGAADRVPVGLPGSYLAAVAAGLRRGRSASAGRVARSSTASKLVTPGAHQLRTVDLNDAPAATDTDAAAA